MAGFVALPTRYNPATEAVPRGRGLAGPRFPNYGAVSRDNPPPQPYLGDMADTGPGGSIQYRRPYYVNGYPGAHSTSVSVYDPEASALAPTPAPAVPIPASRKRIDSATLRRTFNQWNQSFPNGGLVARPGGVYNRPLFKLRGVARIPVQPAAAVQLARIGAQRQMEGPYYPLLTQLAPAGSYGQTTQTLPATPATVASPFTEGSF